MRRCALFLLIALALALLAVGAQAQERGDAAGDPPAAPHISRLSWSGLTIRAEWNPVARATGYDLRWTPEEQRRRHLTVSAERAVDGSPAEVSALWAGRWRVEVRARIGSGPSAVRGEWSRPRIVRVYDAPPRLEVERFDGEYALLNWTGVGASYELEWGERGKAKQFARRDGRSPTLELGPLEAGKTYEFRVRARDGAGRSGYSPTAVFTPTGWRGGRPGAGYVGRIGQIYALWFPQRGAEWYELSWINAADPTETARVRVGTATSGGSRPQVPGQIGREGGFENGTWNVRVRAGPRGVWSPLYPLTLSNQPERLTLELESSRELCTAGTLTEIMWKISGGSAPYALSVENSAVDVSADNARINCGALPIEPLTGELIARQAKTFRASVSDSRGVTTTAAVTVTLTAPPYLIADTTLRYETYDAAGTAASAGSYAFLTDADGAASVVATYEGLRDGSAEGLLIHTSDAQGASQRSLYAAVAAGDLFEWRQSYDCWVRYQVTEVKPDPSGAAARKLLAVKRMSYAFTGCSGVISTDAVLIAWGLLPDLGGVSLAVPIRHGPFQLAPEDWSGPVEKDPFRPWPANSYAKSVVTADLAEARRLPHWRDPTLPSGWTFVLASSGDPSYDPPNGYCAGWANDRGYGGVEICGGFYLGRDRPWESSWNDGRGVVETRTIVGRSSIVVYSPPGPNHNRYRSIQIWVYDSTPGAVYRVRGLDWTLNGSNVDAVVAIARSLFEGAD